MYFQTRQWSDVLEIICDEAPNEEWTALYWWITIVFLVWIPTLTMAACYGFIFKKIRRSARKNPYLSGSPKFIRNKFLAVHVVYFREFKNCKI